MKSTATYDRTTYEFSLGDFFNQVLSKCNITILHSRQNNWKECISNPCSQKRLAPHIVLQDTLLRLPSTPHCDSNFTTSWNQFSSPQFHTSYTMYGVIKTFNWAMQVKFYKQLESLFELNSIIMDWWVLWKGDDLALILFPKHYCSLNTTMTPQI